MYYEIFMSNMYNDYDKCNLNIWNNICIYIYIYIYNRHIYFLISFI
ncbi:MAG: hypothetical protein N7Q72_03630 [Spiroplasma sp. Tabriz.8]|nr:hypothetical protein [Spiroplasma sp. Tabriz.8]